MGVLITSIIAITIIICILCWKNGWKDSIVIDV